jgi:hypothetical protein
MRILIHLDGQPVLLLKVVRVPFGRWRGVSLKRVSIAMDDQRLLLSDYSAANASLVRFIKRFDQQSTDPRTIPTRIKLRLLF